jgi:hypothetical protein
VNLGRGRQDLLAGRDIFAAIVCDSDRSAGPGSIEGGRLTSEIVEELKHLRQLFPDHRLELVRGRLDIVARNVIDYPETRSASLQTSKMRNQLTSSPLLRDILDPDFLGARQHLILARAVFERANDVRAVVSSAVDEVQLALRADGEREEEGAVLLLLEGSAVGRDGCGRGRVPFVAEGR